ncbi:zinc metalloprotease HtpX [Limosilactobacillus secaliphilus]|uniref:Protease HtpX homolog n=1 Tax=Limosilactobacillus secaliphilus TaxID=396268 RepID=A0A0R2I1Y5_9LACO|nr:zinc metalloprotease HtpX [Limosilactobacillus secaliphilus]KRN59247.1 heat shock protein HtpX [Limosilactobacillus secaliphilus]
MLYQQIARNKRKTIVVLAGFFLLISLVGAAFGRLFAGTAVGGVIFALILTLIYVVVIWGQSTDVVMNMNHAKEIHSAQEAPQLWHVVEDMAMVAQVPMPRVFIIDDPSPNAFATGNDPQHAAVAATAGLLQMMDREELEGVMGHEMSHVRNYDIRLQTIALALASAISLLVNFAGNFWWWGDGSRDDDDDSAGGVIALVGSILLIILAPLAATIAQMALSRNREYLADAGSVELTRNPQGLISALEKLKNAQPMKAADQSSSALYISDPLRNARHRPFWDNLFDTHPPLDDRIERLRHM